MVRQFEPPDTDAGVSEPSEQARRDRSSEHLRKVALCVTEDALAEWEAVWREMRHLVTPSGMVLPEAGDGFVPECGWPEFFERLWRLKHYLDATRRLCSERP